MKCSNDNSRELRAYVEAAAQLSGMPLTNDRLSAVVSAMQRIALFAVDVSAVELSNDVEVAGVFIP